MGLRRMEEEGWTRLDKQMTEQGCSANAMPNVLQYCFLFSHQSYCLLFIKGKAAFSGTYLKKHVSQEESSRAQIRIRRTRQLRGKQFWQEGFWLEGKQETGREKKGTGSKDEMEGQRQDLRVYSHHTSWVAVNNNVSILAQQSISLLHLPAQQAARCALQV